ncbi:MAG: hypothetical protein MMC33_002041 [Icmadophila ericetorum]|nr:hypothetical protein [Icmadophila ericetorum]
MDRSLEDAEGEEYWSVEEIERIYGASGSRPNTQEDVRQLSQNSQDPWLLDNYLNASGHLRLGTIFMDLDALSGIIAYKHTGDSVTTVTAAVDRITINHPLEEICDLELSGQVTYATGRSSMEISIQVAKASKEGVEVNNKDVLLTCAFTMVSLDPVTKKPVAIPGLRTETPEERKLFEKGEKNSQEKKALSKSSLLKQTPNDEESDLIHAMWLKHLDYLDNTVSVRKPDEVIYMDQTKIHSTQIMQPQYRNRHNFMIFGGFLLKQTFELAFCCAASCSHSRPTFLSLDPSTFENPVPVGSVLYLTATVAYTDPPVVTGREERANSGNQNEDSPEDSDAEAAPSSSEFTRIQVRVDSRVRNVEHGKAKPTGQFNYTFLVEKDIKVMPRTYSEFMIYTIARRRAQRVSASLGDDGGWNGLQYQGKDRVTE